MAEDEMDVTEEELEEGKDEEPVDEESQEPAEEEPDKPEPDKKDDGKPEISPLEERLAELEKQNQGLLNAITDERRKRQHSDGRLSQITELMSTAKERAADKEPAQKEAKPSHVPIEVTDDGKAFISTEALDALLKTKLKNYEEPLQRMQQEMEAAKATTEQERAFQESVSAVLSEDDEYPTAYRSVQKAADWVNKEVMRMQEQSGIDGYVPTAVALELLAGTAVEQEFTKRFPGMDFERTIKAYDSKWDLKQAIKSTISVGKKPAPKGIDPLKAARVMGKPSSLTTPKQLKGGGISDDDLDSLDMDTIINLTDAERDKLMRLLEKRES